MYDFECYVYFLKQNTRYKNVNITNCSFYYKGMLSILGQNYVGRENVYIDLYIKCNMTVKI